ncbi:uncharacterized protein LOC116178316 isoform X1 [Photinus pyralis]|uniref:Transposase domain-containing protein n=1 Tax=Photinus pyralis TaxID=7054 RepID=A0A1Y1K1J1_PHOPY|nr:uncharacterized protein LOC116175989 isoform X1 [Photinus pyralis]XP_031350256.1 uncharacterized protein LOC116175989 isoform X1 [Photinus pyralis]XP_031350259.1 uncharacterized protein LOC116175989 isoform X1 [Photinus pyralis]XP_031350260.1 uncharacterized protein LOC116175989 isoform X1 [Photinus pyralis]XP_031353641.1 uncharacterized protein LOC116178316 isoform X1 [Photinus pyralis]XP_031353649.1 uncharacterized protein LOC116178316 isoform X1 [Photinus pyralis]XP_031353654.1 uncharac
MSKRKLKEFVGRRQQCRRALQATKQELDYVLRNDNLANNCVEIDHVENYSNLEVNCNVTRGNSSSSDNDNIDEHSTTFLQCTSSSDCSKSEISNDDTIFRQLTEWALKHKISHLALTDLLHVLSMHHPELPLDSRTLLATPTSTSICQLETGQYCYFGITRSLSKLVSFIKPFDDKIELSFNVDGIPLFKSSKLQLWPILGLIKNTNSSIRPFVISVFCGKNKPKPIDTFLNPFIEELSALLKHGFFNDNKHFQVNVHCFVCDAPARAYLKGTKSHTGYSACDKCTVHGEYFKNKVIFDSLISQKRTDQSFRQQLDEDHHISSTPLLNLPINLIKNFPTDYMHNICLGIVRKMLNTWIGGSLRVRLPHQKVTTMSQRLLDLKRRIPIEFNRKPRSLEELKYWKATEFRTFLIYLGPLVLKDVVNNAVYQNFLLIHFSVSILLSEIHIRKFGIELVRNVINVFIDHSKTLYGLEFMVYNVHLLSHICDDVEWFGVLDNFSAFPFENYLGQLKSLVRTSTNPLQQIHRRLCEQDLFISRSSNQNCGIKLSLEHSNGPLISGQNYRWHKQFTKLHFRCITLSLVSYCKADSYVLNFSRDKVIEIHNILTTIDNSTYIIGKEFLDYSDLYLYPYPSSELNIFEVQNLSESFKLWAITELSSKCIVIPYKQHFVAMPIIHSLL